MTNTQFIYIYICRWDLHDVANGKEVKPNFESNQLILGLALQLHSPLCPYEGCVLALTHLMLPALGPWCKRWGREAGMDTIGPLKRKGVHQLHL